MSVESRLQEELRQTRPFRSIYQEGAVGLLRTADRVRSHFEHILSPHGITLQQYNVLRILKGAHPDSLPTMEIAVRMIECAPGITRLLDRLEGKKLIVRHRCSEDRRRVLCNVSNEALDLLDTLETPIDEADRAVLGCLAQCEAEELVRLLERVRAAHPDDADSG